jgi:hypothetical protein
MFILRMSEIPIPSPGAARFGDRAIRAFETFGCP